jgi:hypothetical protein
MRVISLQCPSCAASVSPGGNKCESCGSYYVVMEGITSLLTPAVRLYKSGDQFTFVYGPRKFFLMGRHSRQAHVPIRNREDVEKAGISRLAVRVILGENGPCIQRMGRSPVKIVKPHGSSRDLNPDEEVPLISGMSIGFGLKDHFWRVRLIEKASYKTGVLFSEPGGRVHHLLVADYVVPARFIRTDARLFDLGTVRRSFDEGWAPVLLEEAGESHDFPAECDHLWLE